MASWVRAVATGLSRTDVELAVDELVSTRLFTAVGADLTDDERHDGVRKVLESLLAAALDADRALPYRTLPDPDDLPRHRPAVGLLGVDRSDAALSGGLFILFRRRDWL